MRGWKLTDCRSLPDTPKLCIGICKIIRETQGRSSGRFTYTMIRFSSWNLKSYVKLNNFWALILFVTGCNKFCSYTYKPTHKCSLSMGDSLRKRSFLETEISSDIANRLMTPNPNKRDISLISDVLTMVTIRSLKAKRLSPKKSALGLHATEHLNLLGFLQVVFAWKDSRFHRASEHSTYLQDLLSSKSRPHFQTIKSLGANKNLITSPDEIRNQA
jgi:hypothetical protein